MGSRPASTSTGSSSQQTTATNFRAREFGFFQLGLTASYEIDFWGKFRSASDAAQARLLATQYARDVVMLTLAATLSAPEQLPK